MVAVIGIIWMINQLSGNYNGSSTTSNGAKQNSPLEFSKLVETASSEQLGRIKQVLGKKFPVSKALTVRSQRHHLAYYVGASFSIDVVGGVEQEVGIWIMDGEKNNPNTTYSVNEMAYQFSGMGRAKDTKVRASVVDSEAQALKRRLESFIESHVLKE